MQIQPKVSVIMSVYNDEKYVALAMQSILDSTYKNFEFIICNDCSTDDSAQVISTFSDERIKYFRNEKNMKLAASLNKCIEMSCGEYLMRMDSDDISFPERMQLQVDYLDNNFDFAFCGGYAKVIDENSNILRNFFHPEKPGIKHIFASDAYIHPTVMLRKSALDAVGGYSVSKETRRAEDLDLWCKLYEKRLFGCNIPDFVLNYREPFTALKKRKFSHRVDAYKLLRYWKKKMKLPFKFNIYAFRQIVLGLTPNWFIYCVKKKKAKSR